MMSMLLSRLQRLRYVAVVVRVNWDKEGGSATMDAGRHRGRNRWNVLSGFPLKH